MINYYQYITHTVGSQIVLGSQLVGLHHLGGDRAPYPVPLGVESLHVVQQATAHGDLMGVRKVADMLQEFVDSFSVFEFDQQVVLKEKIVIVIVDQTIPFFFFWYSSDDDIKYYY